ncbi:MAG: GNAT family N-acetyltransferase [Brevefilum sp.]|nr:GNAT family N-acetyltransferase [Brevefilum sp.]MDT8381250.1 GNAT family N-acetyltransferase [Brevefilum sp.]MDW7753831.1 GNAT family N-acetyltransferase [Brevefilum sp.]
MAVHIEKLSEKDKKEILAILQSFWGDSKIVVHNEIIDALSLDGIKAVDNNKISGICHYQISDKECEILTLASLNPGQGIGSALLNEVEGFALYSGCHLICVTTTNDNLNALGFYQKHGYQLTTLYPKQVFISRQLKTEIPEIGYHGIPIRDELRLEKMLK